MTYDYDDEFAERGFYRSLSVSEMREVAAAHKRLLAKKGETFDSVSVTARGIVKNFWGLSWCQHLAKYHDYESRLPRGRSYVRSGCVVDLVVEPGHVRAQVCGKELYQIEIAIKPLSPKKWRRLVDSCAAKETSLLELLDGKLSTSVMEQITDPRRGLFPTPSEVEMSCNCPDWARMCKHIAAALYGLGVRFDDKPELFFLLRGVNSKDLGERASARFGESAAFETEGLGESELADLFGIDVNFKILQNGESPLQRFGSTENKKAGPARKNLAQKKSLRDAQTGSGTRPDNG